MVRCSWIEKAAVDADWSLERKGGMDGGCGKIFIEGEYLDGMMHGSWLMYYEDGSIGSNSVFDRGTGVQRGFADGGSYLRSVIYYKDNVKHGREIHYNIKGEVEEVLLWENGEYVGTDSNISDLEKNK